VINRNPENPVITVVRENGMKNVQVSNLLTVGEKKAVNQNSPATPEY
jgi:hypothetical protein